MPDTADRAFETLRTYGQERHSAGFREGFAATEQALVWLKAAQPRTKGIEYVTE